MNGVLSFVKSNRAAGSVAQNGPSGNAPRRPPRRRRIVLRGRNEREHAPRTIPAAVAPARRSNWHFWEVLIALIVLAAAYSLITEQLRLAPVWLVPGIVAVLLTGQAPRVGRT